MRMNWTKRLLGAVGLLASVLAGTPAAQAATTVNLTAQRANLTLPDGTAAAMWGYCNGAAATGNAGIVVGGSACPDTTATGLPAWTQGPTIIVPAGDSLTINLANSLPSPTSIVILGQVGGSIGTPNKVASPVHLGASLTTEWSQASGTFTPPAQGARMRSFVPEVDGLAAGGTAATPVAYLWTNLKPGTYLYESGTRPSLQVPMGLYGVLIVTGTSATPVAGAANTAYNAVVTPATPSTPAVTAPLNYDADASFLFSEVDVLQNAAVDAAALAMAAITAPQASSGTWAALEQRVLPPAGPGTLANPNYVPPSPACDTVACYPPAVNYAPTYFLVNGAPYDPTNPAAAAQVVADGAAGSGLTTGRVLVRFANAGLKTHIPSFVGLQSLLVGEDGNLLPDVALGMQKTPAGAAAPVVSGKLQSSVLLTAGKTVDVVVTPPQQAGATVAAFADAAFPLLDRELSLSGGGKSFTGLQGYLVMAPAGTTAALLNAGKTGSASVNGLIPAALAATVNPDTFSIAASASTFTGNVLANDVGVTVVAANGALPAGISLAANGSFSYSGAAPLKTTGFGYCAVFNGVASTTQCTTVTLKVTAGASAPVAAAQTFTSRVASLLRVPHPGVLSGATAGYSLTASATTSPAKVVPALAASLAASAPRCTAVQASGSCTVTLLADGSFVASATQPGTYSFDFYAIDAQGTPSSPATATLKFPAGSGLQVTLQDSVTGLSSTLPAGGTTKAPVGQDYRWVIEEDQTYQHDPGNAGFIAPAFAVTLTNIQLTSNPVTGLLDTVTADFDGSAIQYFGGINPGTYLQVQSAAQGAAADPAVSDVLTGTFRVNTVNGSATPFAQGAIPTSGKLSFTLWQPAVIAAGTSLPPSVTATTAQSLATNFHRSYMPVLAAGCTGPLSCGDNQTIGGVAVSATNPRSWPADVQLDPTKRYFISVLPGDAGAPALDPKVTGHTMGAAPIVASASGTGARLAYAWNAPTVLVPQNPLPPGQMSFFVFEDNNPVSGDVDDGEKGLGGFEIVIYDTRGSSGDQAGQITYDLFNQPLTNALANTAGTGTDGIWYPNLCPTTPNGAATPVGIIYTCLPVADAQGNDVSPYTGMALVKNVIPGRIDVQAHPAAWREGAGEQWIQVSTLEGTPNNDSFVHAGEPAYWQEFGPPGFHSFIGFMNPAHIAAVNAAQTGTTFVSVTGRVTNLHMDRPPQANLNDSCQSASTDQSCARAALNYTQCYVALNSGASIAADAGPTVAFATCDADGNFTLTHVAPGDYELFIWDEWLDQIKAKKLVTIPATAANNSTVATGDTPVFNWFTRIQETIYLDLNGNGVRDPGEPGLTNLVANVRFRDGSFSNRLTTDAQGNATHNELFPLFNWYVMENDQTRYKNTGTHIIYDAGGIPDQTALSGLASTEYFSTLGVLNSTEAFPVPANNRVPGAKYLAGKTERIDPPSWITEGMQGFINQTEFVEWGKQPFAAGENGGISGMIYFSSVRAFDDPRLKVQNLSEPGMPRVQVNLYQRTTHADGTTTDTLVDTTTSTSWDDWANGSTGGVQNMSCPGNAPAAATPPAYVAGQTDPFINYTLGANNQYKCYDGQHSFNQVQPAPYDGYYAFPTSACAVCSAVQVVNNATGAAMTNPDGTAMAPVPTLPPGQYVVEVVRPDGFEITKEEDKNILIGDAWIAAAPQQFGSPVNIFILPDQATVNDSNPQGFSMVFPPCVGVPHEVPDFLTVVPEAAQVAPFAGQVRNLCDRKLVTLHDQEAAGGDFQLWTPAPIAGHVAGLMLNDAAAEFDPFSPSFGEKFALPNAPVSIRDYNGTEVLRAYTDKWGTFDFLNVSTWEANVPNPSGYAPNMLTYCMNDPGPVPTGAAGQYQVDPYYNSQYSDFCYNWPILPGITTYLDTPVLPVAAFASHYAPVDCQYPDATPAVLRVDGNWKPAPAQAFLPNGTAVPTKAVGPFVDLAAPSPQIVITALGDTSVLNPAYAGPTALPGSVYAANRITRHYGFGTATGKVQLVPASGPAISIPVSNWGDASITAAIPAALPVGAYQLVVTAANGRSTVDAVTVTVDNAKRAGYRAPWYVAAPVPGTGIGSGQGFGLPHPIQDAIDDTRVMPGDLVLLDAGTYPELAVMWKPLRLQGVGAAAVTIQATKYPNSKVADWRNRINLVFGLTPEGNQATTNGLPNGPLAPAQVDPLPGQEITGGITRLEPSVLATEEGAGITVVAANVQANPASVTPSTPNGCPTITTDANGNGVLALAWSTGNGRSRVSGTDLIPPPAPEANWAAASPNGFYPTGGPLGGFGAASANQPVIPSTTAHGGSQRSYSDFACYAARIDGIAVTGSDAGGGIYVNGWAHNLQISNNRVFGNSGPYAGGVRVGQPYLEGQVANPQTQTLSYNQNVLVHHNMIITNGTDEANASPASPVGTSGAGGGLSIDAGSDNFKVVNNWVCGNFSAGDGGGVGVVGNSTPGLIANNTIIFNEAYQQTGENFGGGLAIEGEPATGSTVSTGVGNINVDANLIQGNAVRSGSGGGVRIASLNGAELAAGTGYVVNLTNNTIVNNVAGHAGAGVALADALYVNVVGNTIAHNDSTGTATGALTNTVISGTLSSGPATTVPSPAGLSTETTSSTLVAFVNANIPRARRPVTAISQPGTLSNNIIWQNRSLYFSTALGQPNGASGPVVALCASNDWADVTAGRCTQLAAQTQVGACDTQNAKYWDVGVVGDHSVAGGTVKLSFNHTVITSTNGYAGTGNTSNDPALKQAYCNGGRINPGAQFEPGSPFQPPFQVNAAATLDESGNYADLSFGPLSLVLPGAGLNASGLPVFNGDYHLASAGGSGYNTGLAQTVANSGHDIDGDARPQSNHGWDIGSDEVFTGGQASLNPGYLVFVTAVGGNGPAQTVTLTNSGPNVLTVGPITTAAPFSVVAGGTTCATTLAVKASCAISVTFRPTSGGAFAGTLTVGNGALNGTVSLFGTALAPAATLSGGGAFPANQLVGVVSSPASVFSYTNTGNGPITLPAAGSVALSGANASNFAVVNNSCAGATLQVNAGCTFDVTFTPSAAGARTASLTVAPTTAGVVNAGSPATLRGTGVALGVAVPTLTTATADRTVKNGVVTLSNGSDAPAVLATPTIAATAGTNRGTFAIVAGGSCPVGGTGLAAGAQCTINVRYTPPATGTLNNITGTITIQYAGTAATQTVTATMTGN